MFIKSCLYASSRRATVLCGAEEGREAGGSDRAGDQEADLPGLPLQRHRSAPGPEEDRPPDPEQVLLAGHREGCGGLGNYMAAVNRAIGSA